MEIIADLYINGKERMSIFKGNKMKVYNPANGGELKMIKSCFTSQNILEQLKLGPMTRDELVEALDTPRSTIYGHLEKLIKNKRVTTEERGTGKVGRPKVYFKLVIGRSKLRLNT